METKKTFRRIKSGKFKGLILKVEYFKLPCSICKKARWVRKDRVGKQTKCIKCASGINFYKNHQRGKESPKWKGGINKSGSYLRLRLFPKDKYYPMTNSQGFVPEHRLVMAKHLGRLLTNTEIVHHINMNKKDNQIGNLQLIKKGEHTLLNKLLKIETICPKCKYQFSVRHP